MNQPKMAKKTCTPFCDDKKPCPQHHELLLAVLNCNEARCKTVDYEASFQNFETCVKDHIKKGWDKNDVVPDPVKEFRFPLIHWASVLGKCRPIDWMIQNGFDPCIQATDTKETALHRFVLCLNQSHISSPRMKQSKMGSIIGSLIDCLRVHDSDLDTPLLVAAKTLVIGRKTNIFEDLVLAMVDKTVEHFGDKCVNVLNAQNIDGNTALHILAKNDIAFLSARKIYHAGADSTIVNNDLKTACNIAKENGSSRIVKLLSQQPLLERTKTKLEEQFITESPPESEEDTAAEGTPPSSTEDHNYNKTTAESEDVHNPIPAGYTPPKEPNAPVKYTPPPVCSSSGGMVCTCIVKKEYNTPQKSKLMPECELSGSANSPGSDAVLVEFLKGAGLLDSVKDLAMKTRTQDEKCLQSKLREIQATQEELEHTTKDIESKKQSIERLNKELESLKNEVSTKEDKTTNLNRKRKSLSLECSQLEKKLHYCDSVLRVVPQKGDIDGSNGLETS